MAIYRYGYEWGCGGSLVHACKLSGSLEVRCQVTWADSCYSRAALQYGAWARLEAGWYGHGDVMDGRREGGRGDSRLMFRTSVT